MMIDRKLYVSARWKRLRRVIFDRDNWRCQSCGKAGRLECDHVIPVHKGGDFWDMGNLQALCRGCHIRKSASENARRVRPLIPKYRREWHDFRDELLP